MQVGFVRVMWHRVRFLSYNKPYQTGVSMNSSPLLFLLKCISFIHKLYDCGESLREEVAELGSWGAFVYECIGPVFRFQMPFSRAKVMGTCRTTVLLRCFPLNGPIY